MDQLLNLFLKFIDLFLHVDRHLKDLIFQFGGWTYVILFLIIFAETGLVVTPFLPGDSLLFACGTFVANGSFSLVALLGHTPAWIGGHDPQFSLVALMVLLSIAAFLGDTVNYWVGAKVGPAVFKRDNVRFLNKKHLERTHRFYERHGGKTIIIARFIPIIRTFAPFVAGIGKMSYLRFLSYNIFGGIAWVCSFTALGFLFGNQEVVKQNFSLVILAIILISVMPGVIEYLRHRRHPDPPAPSIEVAPSVVAPRSAAEAVPATVELAAAAPGVGESRTEPAVTPPASPAP